MWLILPTGFVSLVQDNKDPEFVWVRGRVKGDVELFVGVEYADKVETMPTADYAYRVKVPREVVAVQLFNQVMEKVTYTSHAKEEMNKTSPKVANGTRMSAYYKVWHDLAEMQDYRPYGGPTAKRVPGAKVTYTSKAKTATSGDFPKLGDGDDFWDDYDRRHGYTSATDTAATTGYGVSTGFARNYDWSRHPDSKAVKLPAVPATDEEIAADAAWWAEQDAKELNITDDPADVAKIQAAIQATKRRRSRRRGHGGR